MTTVPIDRLHEAVPNTGERLIPLPPFSTSDPDIARASKDRIWPIPRLMHERIGPFDSIVFAAPNIWQLEPMVFNAAQDLGIPLGAGPAYNPPVVLEMARQLSRALVVLDSSRALEYVDALVRNAPPAHILWVGYAIHGTVRAPSALRSVSSGVTELLPGFPLFYECPHALESGFHLIDAYRLSTTDESVTVHPGPTAEFTAAIEIPLRLTVQGTCRCGAQTYDIIA